MRAIGHPIVGDPTYGGSAAPRDGKRTTPRGLLAAFPRQALHAAQLAFVHPASGSACEWRSELPGDMRELIDRLRR